MNKSKKILLVVPSHDGEVRDRVTHKFFLNPVVKYMPLGVLSIAAGLRHHDISILDASSKGFGLNETIDEIEKNQPEILGLSAVTYRAWAMTEILKRTSCPIKVVGGPHATKNYNIILEQGADAVFVGDAEETFPKWIEQGCYRGVLFGQPGDYNKLPLPARDLVPLEDYRIKPNKQLLFNAGSLRIPMFSSKGCPHKCVYCDVQQKTFNWKTPERVAEEFQSILKLGASSVHILDDCFNVKKDRVIEICKRIAQNKILVEWSARGAVEVREDVIKALAEAGCKRMHVGMEHLDDDILKYFRKSHRFKNVKKFCELSAKYGIQVVGYFIIGAPGETSEYRAKLPELIKEFGIAIPYFKLLSPLNDTEYYRELLGKGVFESDHWLDFIKSPSRDFVMPSGRDEGIEKELEDTIETYINIFHTNTEKDIVIPSGKEESKIINRN